jgi:hypothetical protein
MAERGPWKLERFDEWVQLWVRECTPRLDQLEAVREWVRSRAVDPFAGVRPQPELEHPEFGGYWHGGVPNSAGPGGAVVTCGYWVSRARLVVRCDIISG